MAGIPTKNIDDLSAQLASILTAISTTASTVSITDAYFNGGVVTDLDDVVDEIKAQLGGTTSTTYNFTNGTGTRLTDNDAIYAALNKLDQGFVDLAKTTTGYGAKLVGLYDSTNYWTGTELETVLLEIATQLGGATSTTFNFTAGSILADNDVIYAALEKVNVWALAINTHIATAQGFIPVPLATVVETDATHIVDYLGVATTPTLDLANGDTDSGLVITWVAAGVHPILFQVPLPPDLQDTADLVVHLRAKMGGATDTPTINADMYVNEGDTKVEVALNSVLSATWTEKTITFPTADLAAGAQTFTCELTPAAHANDSMLISAIWIEYTKKLLTS